MADEETLFRIADIAISLAILIAFLVAFVRGELLSRRSLGEVVSHTVREVLKELGVRK